MLNLLAGFTIHSHMSWLGYIGLAALALCWIPQSMETIRRGECSVNTGFLVLSLIGSVTLAIYAWSIDDPVFMILNSITTAGAGVNTYYKVRPGKPGA